MGVREVFNTTNRGQYWDGYGFGGYGSNKANEARERMRSRVSDVINGGNVKVFRKFNKSSDVNAYNFHVKKAQIESERIKQRLSNEPLKNLYNGNKIDYEFGPKAGAKQSLIDRNNKRILARERLERSRVANLKANKGINELSNRVNLGMSNVEKNIVTKSQKYWSEFASKAGTFAKKAGPWAAGTVVVGGIALGIGSMLQSNKPVNRVGYSGAY